MSIRRLYTVVAWESGDQIVHAVGPTSTDRGLLRSVLVDARVRYGEERTEIVPWSQRCARPSVVRAVAAERRVLIEHGEDVRA